MAATLSKNSQLHDSSHCTGRFHHTGHNPERKWVQCDCFSILCCPLDKSCGDNEDADHDNESHQSESDYGNKLTAMIEMKTLNMAMMVKAILTSGQIRGHKYKYTNVIVSSILTSGQIRELHSSLVGFVALAVQLPSDFLT